MDIKNYLFFLFSIFPISILIGNGAINLSIFIISTIFILGLVIGKINFEYLKNTFYLLLFFLISLICNLIFSNDISLSYPRVVKFFFIIFFIISFRYILFNTSELKIDKIYKFWFVVFLIVIIDLLIEYSFGKNILGLSSTMPGRLSSFSGKEIVIGNFFYGFALIFLSYFYYCFNNDKATFALAIFLILISFIIGERANFIKTTIIVTSYIFIVIDLKLITKICTFLLLLISLVIFLNFNPNYKTRYFSQVNLLLDKNGIKNYLKNSQYGAHYNVAKEIFKDNPYFGVGIKNFRIESGSKKYDKLDHPLNILRVASHPHQVHFEFLSETGIFGYLSFLAFILFSIFCSLKSYFIKKNFYQLSGILFVTTSILPILPTGSFLSTYTSSIFWINYAIMMGYIGLKKNN